MTTLTAEMQVYSGPNKERTYLIEIESDYEDDYFSIRDLRVFPFPEGTFTVGDEEPDLVTKLDILVRERLITLHNNALEPTQELEDYLRAYHRDNP